MTHDIVIIGGGIVGASTAYYLSRHPRFSKETHSITIVEAEGIASCASGNAGGFLASDWHPPATTALSHLSFSLHAALADEHDGASKWGYRRLAASNLQADLEGPQLDLRPAGPGNGRAVRSKKRSEGEEDIKGWVGEEVASVMNVSSLGGLDTCAQVHPRFLTKALVELSGAKVVLGTVTSLSLSPSSSVQSLSYLPSSPTQSAAFARSSGSPGLDPLTILVTTLVLAPGPWLGTLATTLLGEDIGSSLAVSGYRAHSVVFEQPEEGLDMGERAVFTNLVLKGGSDCQPEFYPRMDGIYMCGSTDSSPLPSHPSLVEVSPVEISDLKSQAYSLSPAFLDAKVVAQQACYLPVSTDEKRERPLVGRVKGVEGVWVGGGLSCWGITQGPGVGLLLAEGILDGKMKSANVSKLAPP